jgi:hypothetical protein
MALMLNIRHVGVSLRRFYAIHEVDEHLHNTLSRVFKAPGKFRHGLVFHDSSIPCMHC